MNNREFSLLHRILHWTIALGLMFILVTIFLRLNWMAKEHTAQIIQQQLTEVNISLQTSQAVKIGKAIRKPMWDWHIYIGYILFGLYLLRIIYIVVKGFQFDSPFSSGNNKMEKVQFWVYLGFYFFLGISLITGMLMVNGPEGIHDIAETIHKPSLLWLILFLILHFGGLIKGEYGPKQGIVSKMISGKDCK